MTAISVLLGGAAQGGVYALLVLGFVLTWAGTRIVNLAQGSLAVAGAYIAWQLQAGLGVPALTGVALAAALLMALGCVAGHFSVSALRCRPSFVVLVITFGVGLTLQGLLTLRYGNDYRTLPPLLATANMAGTAASADLTSVAVIIGCAACCAGGIALWRGSLGRVMAAVGADRETARTLGIRPRRIEGLATGLGAACAAAGGGLAGMTGVFHPPDASQYTLVCAVIAIAVGVGSPVRALTAAAALGVAVTVARYLLGDASAVLAAIILLLVVLVTRGAGFLQDDGIPAEHEERAR